MEEIFKDIKGYEGYYQVSNLGNIKSLERFAKGKNGSKFKVKEKIRKVSYTTEGYAYVVLAKNGVNKTMLVHRIVADTFIPNPDNMPCVNHKDENKHNDSVDNLEWCSYTYNNTYKNIHLRRDLSNVLRKVIQYDLDMHEIKRWNGVKEAANSLNIECANIIACCNCKRGHSGGFKWRYYE